MPSDMIGAMQRARVLASNPAAAAMMLAATRHRAETGVKDVSDERAKKDAKAEVTLNMADGTIDAKGVSVDDLGQTQQQAYDKPYRELAITARHMAVQMDRQDEAARADAAGNEWSGVLPKISDIWRGKRQKDAYKRAQQLQYKRDEARYYDELAKAQEEQAKEREKLAKEATKGRTTARAEIGRSDLSSLTTSDVATRAGVDESVVANDPAMIEAMKSKRDALTLKGTKDAATARRARVVAMNKDDALGGTFDQWRQDTESQVGELTPSELAHAQNKWRAFEGKVAEDQVKTERAAADQRMQVASFAKSMQDKPAKPERPSPRWTTSDIIASKDDPDVNQGVLHRVANTRLARVASTINKNNSKVQAFDAEIAALNSEIAVMSKDPKAKRAANAAKIEAKRGELAQKKVQLQSLTDENRRYFDEKEQLRSEGFGGAVERKQINGHWYKKVKGGWELE